MTRILGFCAIALLALAALGASADAREILSGAASTLSSIASLPASSPTQLSGTVAVAGVSTLPSTSTAGIDIGSIAGLAIIVAAVLAGSVVVAVRRAR